jgi:superfamily II DNA or RNA helicase
VDYDVRCLILARPTKSEILFTQIVGRALRTAPGKEHALILDHSDTTSRLGFVTDIHHETLNGGKFDDDAVVKRKPPLPKPCSQCACLIPVGVKICPACGFERKIVSSVTERDGELVEFTGTSRKKGQTNAKKYSYSLAEKARFFAQLKGYGLTKNYNPHWASNKYREKFGAWPDWSIRNVVPMTPGPEVSQWIRHTFIAWARSKRRNENQQRLV